MNNIYGYGRCSTLYQDYEYEKKALIDFGVNENNIYLEYGSGADKNRPELKKVMSILKSGDTLKVTDITRLSRSTQHFCEILDSIKEKKICLVVGNLIVDCRNEKLDVMVEAMLKISAVFGELERKMRIEQIHLGLENAKAKGKKLGAPFKTKEKLESDLLFIKYYSQYKAKIINISEFSKLWGKCRNTCYASIKLFENK